MFEFRTVLGSVTKLRNPFPRSSHHLISQSHASPQLLDAASQSSVPPRRVIAGLRRTHGLTWEELAGLVDVTPKVLETWINGAPVPDNVRTKFDRLASLLAQFDHCTSAANRRVLFLPDHDGVTAYALLRADKLSDAGRRLDAGAAPRPAETRTPLSPESMKARRAPHPVLLLGGDLEDERE